MRKVYTLHGDPLVTHHQTSTDRVVPYGRSEGPDGWVTNVGSPFVDIWNEKGGVFVANDTEAGSILYETLTGVEEANKHISEVMGRSWKSIDDTLAVSWEVDAKMLYVAGEGFDVSLQIAGDIFACALQSQSTAVIVHRLDATHYMIATLDLSNGKNGNLTRYEFPIVIADPVLFMGFGGTADSFFTVTTPDTGSVIARWRYDVPVWVAETLHTLSPLQCNTAFKYSKGLDAGFSDTGLVVPSGTSGSFSFMHMHGLNAQDDQVNLVGDRIVAVSTDGDRIGLLIQSYSGNYHRITDEKNFVCSEFISIYMTHVFAMSQWMGWRYTWTLGYTDYDSGKMLKSEQHDAKSSFKQITITYASSGISIATANSIIPTGSFNSFTEQYSREVGTNFQVINVSQLNVPPYGDIWDSRPVYHEMGATYNRTFNNAVKLYCADPAVGVYVYQRFNGQCAHKWISYDTVAFASPDSADLDTGATYAGTIDTVLNVDGVETVIHTRQFSEELGVAFSARYDLNWEPTMPYYTQYQGQYRNKNVDLHGDYTNEEHKTINKSVNLAFKGRYIDHDTFKTLVSWSYVIDAESDIATTLNFREFEDINKLKYNLTWTEDYQSKAWQLIKGWGEFTRRAGFKTVEANGSLFVSPDVTQYPFKTLPISLRMVA